MPHRARLVLLTALPAALFGLACDSALPEVDLPQLDLNNVEAIASFIIGHCGLEAATRGVA